MYNTIYNLDIKIKEISKNPLNIYQVSYTSSYLNLFYFPNDLLLHVFYVQIIGIKTKFYCLRQYPKWIQLTCIESSWIQISWNQVLGFPQQ